MSTTIRRYGMRVALGLCCALASGCAATQPCGGLSGVGISSCGMNRWCNPLIDDPVELERLRFAHRSRAKLYVGLTLVAAGLGGVGFGTGYMIRASKREDSARAQLGSNPDVADVQRREADEFRTVGVAGLAGGAPLVLLGTALIIADAMARPVYPQSQAAGTPAVGGVRVSPVLAARVGNNTFWGASLSSSF